MHVMQEHSSIYAPTLPPYSFLPHHTTSPAHSSSTLKQTFSLTASPQYGPVINAYHSRRLSYTTMKNLLTTLVPAFLIIFTQPVTTKLAQCHGDGIVAEYVNCPDCG